MKTSTNEEELELSQDESFSYIKRISTDKKDWNQKIQHFPKLTLYFHLDCPFCIRVLNYLNKVNKAVELKNIKDQPHAKEELLSIGGKLQVPCLVIDGEALYESLDIIRWISENKEVISTLSS